jgi:hypothetical protein
VAAILHCYSSADQLSENRKCVRENANDLGEGQAAGGDRRAVALGILGTAALQKLPIGLAATDIIAAGAAFAWMAIALALASPSPSACRASPRIPSREPAQRNPRRRPICGPA